MERHAQREEGMGWCVWKWQREKRSFVASTEGYEPCDGWTMKQKSADLTSHPATHLLFFHALSPLLKLSQPDLYDVNNRVWTVHHCVILYS